MCGRYFMDSDALSAEITEGYALASAEAELLAAACRGDICPGADAPALTWRNDSPTFEMMRWGFEKPEGGLIINARVETISQRSMFKGLAERQRCALPATRYYEWRAGDGQKFSIIPEGSELFYLAGLFRFGLCGREFVVLTQPPVPQIARIHDRMPMILDDRSALERWMSGEIPLFDDRRRLRIFAEGPEQLQMLF